jgi:DNA-directed RNA polymerase subunit RPC12/RpoP
MNPDDTNAVHADAQDQNHTLPTDVLESVRRGVSKRVPQMESLRRGNNVPSGMDMYLAGHIDAHQQIADEIDRAGAAMRVFDRELRDRRPATCAECGKEIHEHIPELEGEEADMGGTPKCPHCGENPLPAVGDSA